MEYKVSEYFGENSYFYPVMLLYNHLTWKFLNPVGNQIKNFSMDIHIGKVLIQQKWN